jgi:hypothetical protein
MSLENAIQELTAAIQNATLVFQHGLKPEVVVDAAGFEHVKEEPAPPAEAKKKAKPAPKPTPVVEPEPEPEQAFEELLEEIDESFEEPEPEFKLPAGERNRAYYDKYVQPLMLRLQEKNKPALARLVRGEYQVKNSFNIPTDQWDELVVKANKLLAA